MTRARSLIALGVAALLASALGVPAVAGAQSSTGASSQIIFSVGGGVPVSQRSIPASFAGQLTVDFHGDAASGCASRGLCGYAGTVSWRPPPTGEVEILEYRGHGRPHYSLSLMPGGLNGFGPDLGAVTTAKVALSIPGAASSAGNSSCLDAVATGDSIPLPLRHGRVTFTLAGASPSLLDTRCAGPLAGDITPNLPTPTLALGTVMHGRRTVSLTTSSGFASDGFAGTIASSLRISLGRPGRPATVNTGAPRGIKTERYRHVAVSYRATVGGSVVERVRGDADSEICTELGSCGVLGSLTLAPRVSGATATIEATAPMNRPYRDLLAAMGLARGRASGVATLGNLNWSDGGVLEADLGTASTSCRDSAPLGPGAMILGSARGSLFAEYAPEFTPFGVRTRCPGPGDGSDPFLATGKIPLARLGRRTITLSLTSGESFADYGYEVQTLPHLTLTLTRVHVRRGSLVAPTGLY